MTRLMSLGSLMPGASSKGLSSPRSARPSGLTCWKITRPQVSGTGTPAELTAESILRVRILNFGAQFVEKIRETKVGRICNVKCLQMRTTGNLEDFCVTCPNVSRTGLPAELTAKSISIINLKFGTKNKSVKWVRILA